MSDHKKSGRKVDKKDGKDDSKKRKREPIGSIDGPTVGQLTSHIPNKQVRAEQYAKLKHKAKVHISAPRVTLHNVNFAKYCSNFFFIEMNAQKEKGGERRKRQEEVQRAEKLGVEGPKRRVPKVNINALSTLLGLLPGRFLLSCHLVVIFSKIQLA